jgi:hypothetical protein
MNLNRRRVIIIVLASLLVIGLGLAAMGTMVGTAVNALRGDRSGGAADTEEVMRQVWLDGFALGTLTAAQAGGAQVAPPQAVAPPQVVAPAGGAPVPPPAPAPSSTSTMNDGRHGPGFFGVLLFIFGLIAISKIVKRLMWRRWAHTGGWSPRHSAMGPMGPMAYAHAGWGGCGNIPMHRASHPGHPTQERPWPTPPVVAPPAQAPESANAGGHAPDGPVVHL